MKTYVFLLDGAFFTVVGIGNTGPSADHASALVGTVVALVTDTHQCARPHVGITYYTFTVTCMSGRKLNKSINVLIKSDNGLKKCAQYD